jgi:hypothetical protein
MSGRHVPVAAVLICIGMVMFAQTRSVPVIRQVDHILIESDNPKALFEFFSGTLHFPVAWPVSDNNGFVTGGVGTGNVMLELFRYTGQKQNGNPAAPAARYSGLAFEPVPLADCLKVLQFRALPHSPPEQVVSALPNGIKGLAWTTVGLPSLSKPGMSIFLYEYSPAFLKVDVRRKQLANRLTLDNGGPLGIVSVDKILITSTSFRKDRENWDLLLGNSIQPGSWRTGAGPAIALSQGDQDRIRGIVVKVSSLDSAKAFLKKDRLLGSISASGITLNPAKIQGLNILLTETSGQ